MQRYRIPLMTRLDEQVIDRFWSKVIRGAADECWPWIGPILPTGYGCFTIGSKIDGSRTTVLAHRVAYTIEHGPLPPGMNALHKCDRRPCCNPDHLFPGTQADNMRDCAAKGRIAGQQKTHCANGHPYSGENTIISRAKSYSFRTCRICHNAAIRKYRKKKRLARKMEIAA